MTWQINGQQPLSEMPQRDESLAHVLVSCAYGKLLWNTRHHRIGREISDILREECFMVFEEVRGIFATGCHRRIDVIAFTEDTSVGYIPLNQWWPTQDTPRAT